jgi:hypothetical protein
MFGETCCLHLQGTIRSTQEVPPKCWLVQLSPGKLSPHSAGFRKMSSGYQNAVCMCCSTVLTVIYPTVLSKGALDQCFLLVRYRDTIPRFFPQQKAGSAQFMKMNAGSTDQITKHHIPARISQLPGCLIFLYPCTKN